MTLLAIRCYWATGSLTGAETGIQTLRVGRGQCLSPGQKRRRLKARFWRKADIDLCMVDLAGSRWLDLIAGPWNAPVQLSLQAQEKVQGIIALPDKGWRMRCESTCFRTTSPREHCAGPAGQQPL